MVDVNSPIVKEFLIESFENLSNISEELTQFEKSAADSDLLNAIYRKVHTLKGSASFLGLKKLQGITHLSENVLDKIREDEIEISGEVVDVLLDSFDKCLVILKNIESSGEEGDEDYSSLISTLEKAEAGELNSSVPLGAAEENSETLNIDVGSISSSSAVPSNVGVPDRLSAIESLEGIFGTNEKSLPEDDKEKTEEVNEVDLTEEVKTEAIVEPHEENDVEPISQSSGAQVNTASLSNVREKVQAIKEKMKASEVVVVSEIVETDNSQKKSQSSSLVDSVVRVNVGLLDKIMNVVGELVLNRNQILQFANSGDSSDLNRLAHQLNAITTELQTDIMTTRMQPVGSVLTKFERVVRDLSRQQGKNIKLTITGKDTELDKTLLEAIRDPLTHLIRNSVDHGVEIPEKRVLSGKGEQGHIQIRAYHEGGQVTIEIVDDGNGIDPDRILEKAISKGVISKEKGATLSRKQILNLVFTPGFSTAEQVTNISGRGVGMDVVKSNIEKIGGSVDVNSVVGTGSTFKLKIPLTLAIVPALVVESGHETYAIPQINLVELVRIEEEDDAQIETIHKSEFFRLRGDLIPIFRLNNCLGLENSNREDDPTINNGDVNIAILKAEGAIYGLVVDHVLDTEEIVVKPLSRELKDLSIYGGATIMGDGSVALIIDALGFFNHMGKVQGQKKSDMQEIESKKEVLPAYNDEILLSLLGDGRVYGIPLALVSRLEEFKKSEVEWSGAQPLIRYRGKAMPLILLEEHLNLGGESTLRDSKEDVSVVVVSARGQQLGFVVNEIQDIAINHSRISTETSDRDGFVGTAYINDRTITVLDVFKIVDGLSFLKKSSSDEISQDRGRVLIVEDSELFMRIQRELFTEAGYEVVMATDGQQAMDLVTDDLVAVVTDVDMPIMNGWELIRAIREKAEVSQLPIIAVSSIVSKKTEEIKDAGFDFYFDKQDNQKALAIVNELVSM
jgi:two-component system chemotaxis sensor kinase CheA